MENIINQPTWPFWSTLVATLFGALISWGATYIFYMKSTKDFKEKTEVLRQINNAMASYLEICWGQNNIKFKRDPNRNITGVEKFKHTLMPDITEVTVKNN